ncbi:MAG: hypothetical protein H6618_00695 [Deltaproteobacteria bacterium]|nr:hypothetical protein [Deltaproteobacteria bacterium]
MQDNMGSQLRVAMVYGTLPSVEEIDQLILFHDHCELSVIAASSVVSYLADNSFFNDLKCIPLPDYDENPSFLPGLESSLAGFDFVIIKERIGLYAYQVMKARWKYRFRLGILVDNLLPFPAEDVQRMRTIRQEISGAADFFLTQTEAAKQSLILEGIAADKILRLSPWVRQYAPTGDSFRKEALTRLGLHEETILILHNGQVEWEEGIPDLFHAVARLHQMDKSLAWRLKIAIYGIGSFATEVRERSVKLGLDANIIYPVQNRESYTTLLQAASVLYAGAYCNRDRIDGDPYRYLVAMTHRLPIICARTPLTEEITGKHRLDYCPGSVNSLIRAIRKSVYSKSLIHNIVLKNCAKTDHIFSEEKARKSMVYILNHVTKKPEKINISATDDQITEVENKVNSGQYTDAIDLIESIFHVRELPSHHKSNLYRLIGDCFTRLGDNESGKNAYLQAIDLDPYSAKAHIGLGTVSLTKANYDIGVIHFQKAISLDPENDMANLGLGLSFHGLDELNEAHKWVIKSLEINPENTSAIYTLVRIAHERELYEDTEEPLRQYLKRHPHDHHMIYTLAGILYKLKKFDEVIYCLKEVVSINPMDVRAQSLIKQARRALDKGSERSVG